MNDEKYELLEVELELNGKKSALKEALETTIQYLELMRSESATLTLTLKEHPKKELRQ